MSKTRTRAQRERISKWWHMQVPGSLSETAAKHSVELGLGKGVRGRAAPAAGCDVAGARAEAPW
jgi:hypothetical protein